MVLQTLLPVMEARGLITAEEREGADAALRPLLERLAPSAFDRREAELAGTIARRLSQGRENTGRKEKK
jgi:hypothetical protein